MRRPHIDHVRKGIAVHSATLLIVATLGFLTLSDTGAKLVSLLASSASILNATQTIMYFTPHGEETIRLGETTEIDVRINTRVPINALGATIKYPQDAIEIIGFSKKDSFLDLWTEDTTIKEGTGEIHFSGGTLLRGGIMGTGTVITLSVKGKRAGRAQMYFKDAEVFPHDGQGKKITNDVHAYAFNVEAAPIQGGSSSGSTATAPPPAPNPDFNNDGRVSLADISILAVQLLSQYNARYDLDTDGKITLSDLSILFSKFR